MLSDNPLENLNLTNNLFYTKALSFYDMYKEYFDDSNSVNKDLLSAFRSVKNSVMR